MKIGFILIALTLLFSFNGYIIVRGWQALPAVSAIRPIYLITAILLFLAMMVGMIFGNAMQPVVAKTVSFIGFSYIIVFIYLFLSFLVVDIVRIANYFIGFAPSGLTSFRLWAMVVTLGITGIAMVIGNIKFNHPEIVTLNLSIDKPTQHKVLKIVAASDFHLGISIDKKCLHSYVKMINEQHPDIVLLAGDRSEEHTFE